MDPTITEGCNIIQTEEWDGESSLYDEVIIYEPIYQPEKRYEVVSDVEIDYLPLLGHRVVEEYKEYDMNESDYYIDERNYFVDSGGDFDRFRVTKQPYESAKDLEGEHVIILEGDNNPNIDYELVHVDNVKTILNTDNYYQIQNIDSWPCSIAK